MPSTRRSQRAATRTRLVEAAEAILAEGGDGAAVTVRGLEQRAGVAAPTIYRYFPDMATLITEVAEKHFQRLDAAVRAAPRTGDPVADLAALGRAFAHFGLAHPQQYRVLFLDRASDPREAASRVRRAAGYERLVDAVRTAVAADRLPRDDDAHRIATLLVLSLHGVVSMLIARPDGWGDPHDLVEQMMAAVGYGVVPRDPSPERAVED